MRHPSKFPIAIAESAPKTLAPFAPAKPIVSQTRTRASVGAMEASAQQPEPAMAVAQQQERPAAEPAQAAADAGEEQQVPMPPYNKDTKIEEGVTCYICSQFTTKTWGSLLEHLRRKHFKEQSVLKGTYVHEMACKDFAAAAAARSSAGKGRGRGESLALASDLLATGLDFSDARRKLLEMGFLKGRVSQLLSALRKRDDHQDANNDRKSKKVKKDKKDKNGKKDKKNRTSKKHKRAEAPVDDFQLFWEFFDSDDDFSR